MTDGATGGLRERRMADTRRQLSDTARRLTAERGLAGFTVEEVCEHVGVSRRTFFNYFHSKEEAIVGHADDMLDQAARDAFVAGGGGEHAGLTPTLLDDLAALAVSHVELVAHDPEQMRSLAAAIGKEPQLLGVFMRSGAENERMLRELVTRREGLAEDDPAAAMAVVVFLAVVRHTSHQFFAAGNAHPFADLLHANLDALRSVFAAERPARP
ncbi:TetR/AcrR family transcriptional regulator [Cryobacterium tepidiphilum]|nr:TetR/AcrR family transcriptional regulator [Cryobacterium tepidiphilum]